MADNLETMLALADDFELCDQVFCAIADSTGDPLHVDVSQEPPECQVVSLVWHTSGLIGNGGFRHLFSGDLIGDPQYKRSEAAFCSIGATQAYNAFRDAMALFPDGVPPWDVTTRLRIYDSHPKEKRNEIEARFYRAASDTRNHLADFIRHNHRPIVAFLRRKEIEP